LFSNKNEIMFGRGYENCPEFGVLGGVIFIEFALFHLFTLDIMGVGIGAKKGGVVEKTEIKAFN
jgi:hypothetical protein